MGRLDGKVAIITGGGGAIGSATGLLMAAEGASVVLADIDDGALEEATAAMSGAGHDVAGVRTDVTVEGDVQRLVATAVERFGRLDVLHNNAAYGLPEDTDTVNTPDDAWRKMLDVVFFAAVYGCRHAIPVMTKTGGGSIINTSSGAATSPTASHIAYGSAKGALETMTKYTAAMYGRDNIRCNAISPGFVATPRALELFPPDRIEVMKEATVAPRLAQAEDVARIAVFLASDESMYVSGQVITCNGGGSRGTRW
jgi:NAD(P)-dependent dehydrogenase (short-subunit alcohol dehydrogenase family)